MRLLPLQHHVVFLIVSILLEKTQLYLFPAGVKNLLYGVSLKSILTPQKERFFNSKKSRDALHWGSFLEQLDPRVTVKKASGHLIFWRHDFHSVKQKNCDFISTLPLQHHTTTSIIIQNLDYCPGGWTYYSPRQECYMVSTRKGLEKCNSKSKNTRRLFGEDLLVCLKSPQGIACL